MVNIKKHTGDELSREIIFAPFDKVLSFTTRVDGDFGVSLT